MNHLPESRGIGLASMMLVLCLHSGSGQAEEPHEDLICSRKGETRIVSIFNAETAGERHPSGCRVDYTKDGATRTLWASRSSRAYCAAKAASLVTTLEQGNFSCKAKTLERNEEQ